MTFELERHPRNANVEMFVEYIAVVHARRLCFYRLENLRLEFITAGHFVHTIA